MDTGSDQASRGFAPTVRGCGWETDTEKETGDGCEEGWCFRTPSEASGDAGKNALIDSVIDSVIDLRDLQQKAKADKFYGETLIKWEAGEIQMIEVHQKLKPKDFGRLVLIQVI